MAGTSGFSVRLAVIAGTGAAMPGRPDKLKPYNALVRAPETVLLAVLITVSFGCAVFPGVSFSALAELRALGAVSLFS